MYLAKDQIPLNTRNDLSSQDTSNCGVINLRELPNQALVVSESLYIKCKECPRTLQRNSDCRKDLDKTIWTCESCKYDNDITDLNIELESIPQDYKIEIKEERRPEEDKDYHFIFVIDISDSMCSHLVELKQQLRQVINKMIQNNPDYKVGLILFGDNVQIYGDGHLKVFPFLGDSSQEQIMNYYQNDLREYISLPIKKSGQFLLSKIDYIQEDGRTALGPAILAAIQMAGEGH